VVGRADHGVWRGYRWLRLLLHCPSRSLSPPPLSPIVSFGAFSPPLLSSELHLKDAALRERRRCLLGANMVAAVRRQSRAQLGALVDGERQTHICVLLLLKGRQAVYIVGVFFCLFLFQTATSDEETRTLETLRTGRPTNAHLAAVSALASCFHICVLPLLKGRQAVLIMGSFFVCFFFRLSQVKKKEDWRL
jgi:hypothetical protein